MTSRGAVARWLDRYVAAWRSYDREAIESLFTEDAEYWYHPFDPEPVVGAAAIADDWLAEADPPGSWEAEYAPYAVEGERAVATGKTTYADGRVFWNVWTLEFAEDGRCRRFVEWYMEH